MKYLEFIYVYTFYLLMLTMVYWKFHIDKMELPTKKIKIYILKFNIGNSLFWSNKKFNI